MFSNSELDGGRSLTWEYDELSYPNEPPEPNRWLLDIEYDKSLSSPKPSAWSDGRSGR